MIENQLPAEDISLEALRSGDRKEFSKLVDVYSGRIYHLLSKMLNDSQDAEDALQETFIKAYRALPNFEGRSSLYTWLHRIAMNEALMMLRKRKPEFLESKKNEDTGEDEDEFATIVDWCCLPEEELLGVESQKFLNKAIESLPLNLRLVFLMRDIEGMSVKETAELLHLSEMNVKTRLFRARSQLRERLSSYFSEIVSERTATE